MESLVKIFSEKLSVFFCIVVGLYIPGMITFFMNKRDLFIQLDIIKLSIIVMVISFPTYFVIFLSYLNVINKKFDIDNKSISDINEIDKLWKENRINTLIITAVYNLIFFMFLNLVWKIQKIKNIYYTYIIWIFIIALIFLSFYIYFTISEKIDTSNKK